MGADAGSLRFHLVTNVFSVTEDLQLPLPTDNVGLALSGIAYPCWGDLDPLTLAASLCTV